MDLEKQLERQVKEKCGNRIVKIILDRIQVVGQKISKSHETSLSLKIFPKIPDAILRNDGRPFREPGSGPGPGPSNRPQRNKASIYTHYFDTINDRRDDDDIESSTSCSDSAPDPTSDSEFESLLLNPTKITSKKSKKTEHSLMSVRTNQCDLCPLEFTIQHRLENHILRVHVVDKPFECGICFKSFLTENMLHLHVKRDHEMKNFSCRYCHTKSFKNSDSLNKHIEAAHKGYKEHCDSEASGSDLMCPVCDTWFLTDTDLAKHLKMPKPDESTLKCEICSVPVHTPCLLNRHRLKIHSENPKADNSGKYNHLEGVVDSVDEMQGPHSEKITEISASVKNQVLSKSFSCVVCSAIFSRRCDLDLHESQEKHRRWKCPICGKLFNWRKDLKTHTQSAHSDARPFHCTHEGCSKTYKVMKDLKKHMVMHATDRVLCKECFKYFTQKAFTIHAKKCHEKNRKFQCNVCSETWGTLARLKMHLRTHTKERPFPCKFCDASYKCSKEANRHMKKCQDRSEDQRKQSATLSNATVRSAEKRKPKKQNASCNGNGTELQLIKQEVDPKYLKQNSLDLDQPGAEFTKVKLELVPKKEMWTHCSD